MFVGAISKSGAYSQIFNEVGVGDATHLKAKDNDQLFPIDKDLELIRKRKMGDNSIITEKVHYSDIAEADENDTFFCVVREKEIPLDGKLYSQLSFMAKNADDKGTHFRCDDGVHIRRTEVQIPAYRKIHTPDVVTTRLGDYYTYEETVRVNGQIIALPNENVAKDETTGKWYCKIDDEWVECEYSKKSIKVNHLLLDGSKVIDINQLKQTETDYVIEGVDGEDVFVGKKEITLTSSFVQGSSIVPQKQIILPKNQLKQIPRIHSGENLIFRWAPEHPGPNGILRIEVNASRSKARFIYKDHEEVYVKHGVNFKSGDNTREYRVQKIEIQDLGEEGIRFDFIKSKIMWLETL